MALLVAVQAAAGWLAGKITGAMLRAAKATHLRQSHFLLPRDIKRMKIGGRNSHHVLRKLVLIGCVFAHNPAAFPQDIEGVSRYTGLSSIDIESRSCDELLHASRYFATEGDLNSATGTDGEAAFLMSCALGTSLDKKRALLERAVEAGFLRASAPYGDLLYKGGNGSAPDPEEALDIWQAAIDAGHTSSMVSLAGYYLDVVATAESKARAFSLLEEAAGRGDSCAKIALADLKLADNGSIPDNAAKVVAIYQAEALRGTPKAKLLLGRMYENGTGVRRDEQHALKLYEEAARDGNRDAIFDSARLQAFDKPAIAQELLGPLHLDRYDAKAYYALIHILNPQLRVDDEYIVKLAVEADEHGHTIALAFLVTSLTLGTHGWAMDQKLAGTLARPAFKRAKLSRPNKLASSPSYKKQLSFSIQQALRKGLIPSEYDSELDELDRQWGTGISFYSFEQSLFIMGAEIKRPIFIWDSDSPESPASMEADFYENYLGAKPPEDFKRTHEYIRGFCRKHNLSYVKTMFFLRDYKVSDVNLEAIVDLLKKNARSTAARQQANIHLACASGYLKSKSTDRFLEALPGPFSNTTPSNEVPPEFNRHVRAARRLLDLRDLTAAELLLLMRDELSDGAQDGDADVCARSLREDELMSDK